MTKEKLKQEIEDYLTKDYCCGFKEECKDGVRIRCSEYEAKLYLILRFAEPREKRITILEKRCANYEMTISKMEKGTCDICKEIEKDKKIEELEAQIEKMKCCYNCSKWNEGLLLCNDSPVKIATYADYCCKDWKLKELEK